MKLVFPSTLLSSAIECHRDATALHRFAFDPKFAEVLQRELEVLQSIKDVVWLVVCGQGVATGGGL